MNIIQSEQYNFFKKNFMRHLQRKVLVILFTVISSLKISLILWIFPSVLSSEIEALINIQKIFFRNSLEILIAS